MSGHQPGYTGRSPSGNLRNFAAMTEGKLLMVYSAVKRENNDGEALLKLEMVLAARQLIAEGQRTKPDFVDQDVWDTLAALAL